MTQGPLVPFWGADFSLSCRASHHLEARRSDKNIGDVSSDLVTAGVGTSQRRQMCLTANVFVQRNHFHWPGAQLNL